MKSVYIVVLVVIIISGIVWFNIPPNEAVAPVIRETPTQTTQTELNTSEPTTTNPESAPVSNPSNEISSPSKTFEISGKDFVFDITEIKVKQGDTVTINFTSIDGFHDVVIDEYNAKTERVKTGGTTKVTFVTDKVGTFEYYCSVGSHRVKGMVGKLIVE